MAEEGPGFFLGVSVVVGGLIFIVCMGVYSMYHPLKGKNKAHIKKKIGIIDGVNMKMKPMSNINLDYQNIASFSKVFKIILEQIQLFGFF